MIHKIIRGFAKLLSPHPFVEILSIHLGHTLIEAAAFNAHRPLAVRWREPLANRWLVEKLKRNLQFPRFNNWVFREIEKKTVLGKSLKKLFRNMSDQYYMLNLGFNGVSESKNILIQFTDNEEKEAVHFMERYNLKKGNYVCYCIRDETYYQQYKKDLAEIDPHADFTFRNASVNNYISSAELLAKKGYKALRMGFFTSKENSSQNSESVFISPSEDKYYRPWIEAYLFKHCAFCVGMMTGGTLYASFFSRPVLWTDIFWRGTPVGKKADMIVPKIITREAGNLKGESLSLLEIRQMGPPPDNNWNHFERLGLSVRNCSPEELSDGVLDMLIFLKSGKYFQSKEEKAIHKMFSAIHYKNVKRKIVVPTRLAPSWAKKYAKLISKVASEPKTSQLIYYNYWTNPDRDEIAFNKKFMDKKTADLFQMRKKSQQDIALSSAQKLPTFHNEEIH